MMPIFDTHAHYDDDAFDEDRDELLSSLPENGVAKVVDVGASLASCERARELAHRYPHVYCALGVHPTETGELDQEKMDALKQQMQTEERCLAVGEIGLDYYWPDVEADVQKKWFDCQMEIAREIKKPVIIHSREACKDTLDMMQAARAGEIGGVVHCYSYTKETAAIFLKMGFYFGIGGVVTYKNAQKLKDAVAYIPMDRIVLETDCPYLTPVPNRGKRNSSLQIPYVIAEIARIKDISEDAVREITWKNAHALYRI